jgi:hypothetical protein
MRLFSPASLGRRLFAAAGVLLLGACAATAQEGALDAPINVGYIDPALPVNLVRFRSDANFHDINPDLAEYFYAKEGALGGPGPSQPERRINFYEQMLYVETTLGSRFSTFLEGGLRYITPANNGDDFGFGDMNVGFKWAFLTAEDMVTTFQLRTYIPTGNVKEGLGTGHVSLEPALLTNYRLSDFFALESELRYWIPVGGTDFAGDVVRYGVGLSFAPREHDDFWVSPVVEVVGWTVLGGKLANVSSPTVFNIENASGTTIVNVKVGLRFNYAEFGDVYIGYGHAVTDTAWYRDTFRLELRCFF